MGQRPLTSSETILRQELIPEFQHDTKTFSCIWKCLAVWKSKIS